MNLEKPPYAPNVVNQTVSYKGTTWKGNPGEDWVVAGGGSSGVDFSQVPSVQQFVENQFAGENVALEELVKTMLGREKPLDIYSRLETEAGLPELRGVSTSLTKEISGLEDYLDQIEPDVTARTRESLVTEAQRRGMVASQREPFLQKLTKLGTALGRVSGRISEAERGIGTKTELALSGQEMEIEPLKFRYQVMVDRNARRLTGFTADRQTQLDLLFDKWQRDRQLEDREWQAANQLAQEERTYMKNLQGTAAEKGVKLSGSETSDQILGLIGTAAAEAIQWERRNKGATGGTATERKEAVATVALRNDVKNWTGFEDLVRKYGDILPTWQIRQEYNNFHTGTGGEPWGPAKESEKTVQGWSVKPKTEGSGGLEIRRPDGSVISL